ncbi:HET-domain-containing protein [Nemania abortiva]|nr:HET-domain-containing protein [Nemania abortiva]
MRLINTRTHQLREFSHEIPPYAILSHTWGSEEVTFQDYLLATGPEASRHARIRQKAGFSKIVGACHRARNDGLGYVWCDTNCIDKSSSAELSEAINSMYAWYRDSVFCYVFLADVDASLGAFAKSRWFTRGWTLQELLAPRKVIFFDGRWQLLGDREGLADTISKITRIHIGALHDRNTVPEYSIAQRMSWAADRQTSRQEDIAYCLLGIFDVSMPLLYGEGPKAFSRLQEAIIKISDDQSLLAWEVMDPTRHGIFTGVFARGPAEFRHCGSIVRDRGLKRDSYTITNIGVLVNLAIVKTESVRIVFAGLNCAREVRSSLSHTTSQYDLKPTSGKSQGKTHFQIWIPLYHVRQNHYFRGHCPSSQLHFDQSYPILAKGEFRNLYLNLADPTTLPDPGHSYHLCMVPNNLALSSGIVVVIAAGKLLPRGQFFERVFPMKNIIILPLDGRGNHSLSHQFVSDGKFALLVSVYWNDLGQPSEYCRTIWNDQRFQTLSGNAVSGPRWRHLFDSPNFRQYKSKDDLYLLHRELGREVGALSETETHEDTYPLVRLSQQFLLDTHGVPVVVVEIIFRE